MWRSITLHTKFLSISSSFTHQLITQLLQQSIILLPKFLSIPPIDYTGCWIVLNHNTRSTQKSPVRQQNARFDTKKPGSTQKCPPQHASVDIAIINPPPSCEKYFFFQFYSNILFLRTHKEIKMKLYWYQYKYIRYHHKNWNVIILFCLWWP